MRIKSCGSLGSDSHEHEWLKAATRALEKEDKALKRAFDRNTDKRLYQNVNQGLGYWLYETTLVYVIFKAWLPTLHVVWDWPCKPGQARRADLCVLHGKKVTHAFEAKWCNTHSDKLLLGDAAKLRAMDLGSAGRYLLAFWWNDADEFASDVMWLQERHTELEGRGWFLESFHTDIRAGGGPPTSELRDEDVNDKRHAWAPPRSNTQRRARRVDHYFGVAAIELAYPV